MSSRAVVPRATQSHIRLLWRTPAVREPLHSRQPRARTGIAFHGIFTASTRTAATTSTPPKPPNVVREARNRLNQFRHRVKEDKATVREAKACLKELRQQLQHLPLHRQKEECINLQAGAHIMLWLITKAVQDPASLVIDKAMMIDLCWFALPEDLEDYIYGWAERDLQQPFVEIDKAAPHRSPQYRVDMLFDGLVNAYSTWYPESPDAPLAFYKRLDKRFGHHKWRPRWRIFLYTAQNLQKLLNRDACPQSDPKLFEYFVQHATEAGLPAAHAEIRARLLLFHPTRPQAQPLLDYMKTYDQYMEQIWRAKPSAINAWARHLMRAAYILRRLAKPTEAERLERIVETRSKPTWEARKYIWLSFSNDPKLRSLQSHGDE